MCVCFVMVSNAQNEKSLDLSMGYGFYRQNSTMGNNFSFSTDYRIDPKYSIGQMSQFGFMQIDLGVHKANYVNQHISLIGMRNLVDNKHFICLAGLGLGYTNYHTVELKQINKGDAVSGTMINTHAIMQLSFPLLADMSYKLSKTVALGVRFGAYIPTQGGFLNYKFLNPQIKISL